MEEGSWIPQTERLDQKVRVCGNTEQAGAGAGAGVGDVGADAPFRKRELARLLERRTPLAKRLAVRWFVIKGSLEGTAVLRKLIEGNRSQIR